MSDRPAPSAPEAPSGPETPAAIEPLAYRKRQLPAVVGVPMRTLERAIHRGDFPRPDRRLGRVSLWSKDTIARWLAEGSQP